MSSIQPQLSIDHSDDAKSSPDIAKYPDNQDYIGTNDLSNGDHFASTDADSSPVFLKRGVVDVFLGRDRDGTLRADRIVWNKGFGPWADSVKVRMQNVLTKKFLSVGPPEPVRSPVDNPTS